MSQSIHAVKSTPQISQIQISQIQKTISPAVSPEGKAAKTAPSFGNTPAASLSISS